jgi:hypothetical protein
MMERVIPLKIFLQPTSSCSISKYSQICSLLREYGEVPRHLVNREEQGKLIAQTSGAISKINKTDYIVRSKSGYNTYAVIATHMSSMIGSVNVQVHV